MMSDVNKIRSLLGLEVNANAANVIIYSEQFSERLQYVCRFVFNHVLKVNFSLCHNQIEFATSKASRINYSHFELPGSLQVIPHPLLFESGVSETRPLAVIKNNMIYFYENLEGFHIDVFSAVFYFISRYEEWQSFKPDNHQRFEASESILFPKGFHLKPVVDIWINELRAAMELTDHEIKFPDLQWRMLSTMDVDNVYAFKSKGVVRTWGACARDVLKGNLQNLIQRIKVLREKKRDPFDIYEEVSRFCLALNIPLIYFFLFRTGTKFDRTLDPKSPAFKEVFNHLLVNKAFIGIHPSYYSIDNKGLLENEILQLAEASSQEVVFSRQHYLRFNIRETPVHLLENNILVDFSMGFASTLGFRAGTSHPFYYFDFKANNSKQLLMVPFCAMDGAFTIYKKTKAEAAQDSFLSLAEEVKRAGGNFITVFHERSFSDHLYPGFGTLYKKLHAQLNLELTAEK